MSTTTKMMRTDVYDQLKERLFTGELRTGQFVSQRELASLLGATLNPVREAIRKLEAEGLINVYAQKGIQIVEGGPKAINDAYDYRYFAKRADKEAIDGLIAKVEQALKLLARHKTDVAVRLQVLDMDYQFHKDLVDYQENSIISKHYSLNAARLRLFRVNTGQPLARLDTAAQEHREILRACRTGDAETAAAYLEQHVEISREHALGIRPMRPLGEDANEPTALFAGRSVAPKKKR
jgi:DNA-binding GntR family transcriptional regulator